MSETEQKPNESRYLAIQELRRLRVSEPEIAKLINSYPLERVERQLRWLSQRRFWKASAFIVAAIVNDYDPPAAHYEEAALNSPTAASSSDSIPPKQEPNL